MPGIKLYTSNRMETLVHRLAETVEPPLSTPFKPEAIVVQSKGMERWISMQLAGKLGIWANCRYFFPNEIIAEIFAHSIPGTGTDRIFDTDKVSWQIMKILPQCASAKGFESIADYISGTDPLFRAYQLSARIADTFDQYLTFRPEMILDWDKGAGDNWQAGLWRALMREMPLQHPPALRNIFFERIKNRQDIDLSALPERIAVFGISSIPKYHLDILAALSRYIDVNIFFMNPSMEYWADIHSGKNIALTLGHYDDESSADALHLEKGNSLLASMGRQGSDFLYNIIQYSDVMEYPLFEEPAQASLLECVQYDILHMLDRGAPGDAGPASEFSEEQMLSDSSISIHSCHSALREIEVLHDNLLNMFGTSGLEPRDIIVMTPDIEEYSPYISAIFDSSTEEHRIPYSLADMSVRKESLIDTFFAVLDLEKGRFGAGLVLDILERGEVMRRFGFSDDDVNIIRAWIKETNINWGLDAQYREGFGAPAYKENTWEAGIERLLLGYAMPASGGDMYAGILPYDIEGSESSVLGRFIDFFNSLSGIVKLLSENHSLKEWSAVLSRVLELPDTSSDPSNEIILTETIARLAETEELLDFHERVSLVLIREYIENRLKESRIRSGFLTGGVTFCAMLPMRSIPFKVVCLIGMNDGVFPSGSRPAGFDLIALHPRRGDRSRSGDDRYIFLESIISARKKLYISYAGQDIRDNSEIPPSVLVSELLDYIEQGYTVTGADIKDYVFTRHPLQAFSRKYFMNLRNLFSYSAEYHKAGKTAAAERRQPGIFINGKLSEHYEHDDIILLDDLIRFFTDPAKHIITNRLGIYLEDRNEVLNETEPFVLTGLDRYRLEDILCERLVRDEDISGLYETSRAGGLLPHGFIGESSFKKLVPEIKNFSLRIKEYAAGELLPPLNMNIRIKNITVTGVLEDIRPEAMVSYRYAKAKPADRIRSWIKHLALNASGEPPYPVKSVLICRDAAWETDPVDNSIEILTELTDLYIKGMNELIRFFPETSLEYAVRILGNDPHHKALHHAENKWTGSDFTQGEGSHHYNYLCFRNINPFDRGFAETSLKIYEPMLIHQRKIAI